MSLWMIWVFVMLVLLWGAAFVIAPTFGALIWGERLNVAGRVALGAVYVLVYFPALVVFGVWLIQQWVDLVGAPL